MVMDDAVMLFLVVQPSDYSAYILYSPPLIILFCVHFILIQILLRIQIQI